MTESALHPLAEAIEGVRRSEHPGLIEGVAHPFEVTDETGWVSAARFTDGSQIADFLSGAHQRWGIRGVRAATLTMKGYGCWLTAPAVLGWARNRRVPLLTPNNVLVRMQSHQSPYITIGVRRAQFVALPDDPAAGSPDCLIVPDEAAMLDFMRDSLITRHCSPLIGAIADFVRPDLELLAGRRNPERGDEELPDWAVKKMNDLDIALWGAVANGVARSAWAADLLEPGAAEDTAGTLLRALGLDHLAGVRRREDDTVEVTRQTCCMARNVKALKVCANCCLNDSERTAQRAAGGAKGQGVAQRMFGEDGPPRPSPAR